jgi:hypothetical protein
MWFADMGTIGSEATSPGIKLRYLTQNIGIDLAAQVHPHTKHSTIDLYAAML